MLRRAAWLLTLAAAAAMPLYVVRFSVAGLPSTLLEALVLAAAATTSVAYRRKLQPLPRAAGLAALWVAVGLVAAAHAPNTWSGLGLWRAYFLEPVLLAWCIWQQADSAQRVRRLLATAVGAGTIVGAYAVVQWFTGYGIPHPWQEESVRRVTSWLGYPNAVALLVGPLALLAAGLGVKRSSGTPRHRYLYLAAAGTVALAVLFARSEGGLIGLAAGGAVFGSLYSKLWRRVTLAVIVAVAIAIAAVPSWRSYAVRTATLNDCPVLYECSLTLRRTQWADTWAMLSDGRLLYGSGLGGYQAAMLPYHNHPGIEIYLYPHNVFLNFWAELGLPGLATFLALVGWFAWGTRLALRGASRPLVAAAAAAMAALLVHGLVDVPYFKNDLAVLFWLILLVPFLARRIDESGQNP